MRNHSFDILKLFLALLVVFIHIHVPWRDSILPLTRCAVPCFFMISGYFLYTADKEKMRQRVRNGIRRMFNITLFATLLYMIPWIWHHMQTPDVYQIGFADSVNFVFLGIPLFLPEGVHLWYLQAYLYVLIVLYVLLRKSYFNRVLFISVPLLLTLHIFVEAYCANVCYIRNADICSSWIFPCIYVYCLSCCGVGNACQEVSG